MQRLKNSGNILKMGYQTQKKIPTIVVHQPPRGKYAPSISPFPIKLETYLRMTGVPYKSDYKNPFSKKGKTPWMTADGVDVADTYFCIDYLKKNYDLDMNKHLSEQEKAIAISFRTLVEDHLLWAGLHWRLNKENFVVMKTHVQTSAFFRNIIIPVLKRRMCNAVYAQGMGRHNWDEIRQLLHEDLLSLSTFLGEKKYLMGDQPSEVDCSLFGMMCQLLYNQVESPEPGWFDNGPGKNLKQYTLRMKEEFWPDWDQCVYPRRSSKL